MKMKKALCLALCATMVVPAATVFTACDPNSKTTVINCAVHNGGVRWAWLEEAGARFSALKENESYAEGKTGVKIEITPGNGLANEAMATDAYNIYFVERTDTYGFINSDLLLDISEVFDMEDSNGVKLKDRIYPEMMPALTGDDPNKYYVLPGWEFYAGISYDVESFNKIGSWFAAPAADQPDHITAKDYIVGYPTKYGTADMLGPQLKAKKSCGPDGKYGTNDDGLPTSLQEMLILCAYQNGNGVEPIHITGKHIGYVNYMVAGLWASLAGYEQMKTIYTFDGTPVECIKLDEDGNMMFTDEPLFEGINYIKKPVTEMVPMTMANGYRSNDMAAKYYATAFLQAINTEVGLMSADSRDGSVNHTSAELNLLLGGHKLGDTDIKRKGMIVDGTYWWIECELDGKHVDYNVVTEMDANDRDIRFMPLPTSLNTTTTEGNGEKNTMLECAMSVTYVNNNIKDNPELVDACIDFLSFLYSEEELRYFTENTGSMRPINYSTKGIELDSIFYNDLLERRNNSNVVYFAGDNEIFKHNRSGLKVELSGFVFKPVIGGVQYHDYIAPMRNGVATAKEIIEATRFHKSSWFVQ